MDPQLRPSERDGLLADLEPALVPTEQEEVEGLLADLGPADGVPLGRPIHLTSGTTGRPKGVYSGLLDPDDAEALVAEERSLWGSRPTTSTWCSARCTTRLPSASPSAPCSPAAGSSCPARSIRAP